MRCFIQDLNLNVHPYLDRFLHRCSSSFDNHWRYHQCYHELLSRQPLSFLWCIKAYTDLNGRKQPPKVFCKIRCSKKFCKIYRKIPVPESLCLKSCSPEACNFIKKETLARVFSCELC